MAAPDRADKVARRIVVAAAAIWVLEGAFARSAHKPVLLVAAPIVLGAICAAALRLDTRRRRIAAGAMLALFVVVLGVEIRQGRRTPCDASAAARRGVAFDTRTLWEVIHDERARGVPAFPVMEPRPLGSRSGVVAGERVVLPLGGISGRSVVFCNEGGAWATYESDERGFNNPRGVWSGAVDVGIVGEAFAAGACVPRGASAADLVRARFPGTINLGMAGNGPLLELAGVVEYLALVRPRHVLWLYYHNDLGNLEVEKVNPILLRYLDADGRQGLADMQPQIDAALTMLALQQEPSARTWPGALAAVGLSRQRTPGWMADLIMGEDHFDASAALRLDKLGAFAGARLAGRHDGPPPDLATFERVLRKAKATVAGWGGTLHFVYLADVHNLAGPDHPLRKPVLDVVRAVDLPLVDLHPVFAGARDPRSLRYHEASHLSEEGYRLVAEKVLAGLH